MSVRAEKTVLTEAEVAKVMQAHFRQFVTAVKFVVAEDGAIALEVHFAQRALQLRLASGHR